MPKTMIGDSPLRCFVFGPPVTFTNEQWAWISDQWVRLMLNDARAGEQHRGNVYRHPDVVIEFAELAA